MQEINPDLYKLLVETANEGIWAIDSDYITSFVNDKMAAMLGYTQNEMMGMRLQSFMDDEGKALVDENVRRRKNNEEQLDHYKLINKEGSAVWVFGNVSRIINNGEDQGALGMFTDVTRKYYADKLLKESHERYMSLFEESPVPIWYEDFSGIKRELDIIRDKGVKDIRAYFENSSEEIERVSSHLRVIDVNRAVVELNEAESKEQMLEDFKDLITSRSAEHAIKQFEAMWAGSPVCEFDAELRTFKGNTRFVRLKWTVVKGDEKDYKRVHLTTPDLTQRIVDENLSLQNSNREKAVLLKEIHHRVKNNLQIITSLLNLQSRSIEDNRTRDLFEMSLNRIQSMAKVHELLYRSNNFSKINYKDYLETLIHPLIVSMKGLDNNIHFELDVDEIELNINTAIPLGLLINEILTNSLKHGIREDEEGSLYVKIKKIDDDVYVLNIGDFGIGFSPENSIDEHETLGLQLISSLTEQLSGEIERKADKKGTHYQIQFHEMIQNT